MQPEATMVVLVSDTSVLIDLERGNLLETAFACGLTMIVPDLLYRAARRPLADLGPSPLQAAVLGGQGPAEAMEPVDQRSMAPAAAMICAASGK
jgi:hypothetical protein